MKYKCVIEASDFKTKLDAMAQAARDESMWKPIKTADLSNKCGSCKHFRPYCFGDCSGTCAKGNAWGPRSRPACKSYERKWE